MSLAETTSALQTRPQAADDRGNSAPLIELRNLVSLFRRQVRIVMVTAAAVLTAGLLYLVAVTPKYTASTLLFIDTSQANLLETDRRAPSPGSDNARVESEAEILRSNAVAMAVVEAAGLVADAEFGPRLGPLDRWRIRLGFGDQVAQSAADELRGVVQRLQQATTVRRRGLTYVIEVSVQSRNPARAAELANLTAEIYIAQQVSEKVAASLGARDVLAARLAGADQELIRSERAFDEFLERNLPLIEREDAQGRISTLRQSLERARSEAMRADVLAVETRNSLQQSDWAGLAQALRNETLAELERQRARIAQGLAGAAPGTDAALDLRAELERLEARLTEESGTLLDGLRTRSVELQAESRDLQNRLRSAVVSADLPPELLTDLFSIQQQAAIARSQYQSLLSRLHDFETQADLQIADARIVSPALQPGAASFPDRRLVAGLSLFLAVIAGAGAGFIREFHLGGFVSEEQVQEQLGIGVAASAPRVSGGSDTTPADLLVEAPLSHYAESVRRLRAMIERALGGRAEGRADEGRPGQVIMVTSTIPGEGKSTTALALARSFALTGRRTLLFDADMRKPAQHRTTGHNLDAGVFDFLQHGFPPVDSFMRRDFLTPLELLLGAGRANQPTDQLLAGRRFADLMQAARAEFDVIVLDTPPILPVVDGLHILPAADAVVMVVKWAETPQQEVLRAFRAVDAARKPTSPVLGFVNHRRFTGGSGGYYAYYD